MEKHVIRWSYWVGMVCVAIAIGWRGLNTFGWLPEMLRNTAYMTFYKGALLFLLVSIATANSAWFKSQKS